MNKSSENISQEINSFFNESPTLNQKAWGMINQFYHIILTYMDENNISQADLAKRMGKSRSAVSQLFSKTPNITIKKMVEIADAIGINLEISSPDVTNENKITESERPAAKKYITRKPKNLIKLNSTVSS